MTKGNKNLILLFILFGIISNVPQSKTQETFKQERPGYYKVLINENDTIKIPFLMHKKKPLMELEINGKKATLMIDNGVLWDQVWLFGSPLVKKLGLKPITNPDNGSSSISSTSLYSSNNLKLAFKDIIFFEQPVLISPTAAGYYRMFPYADGQLCNTFFKQFIVEFNFIQNVIILHNPKKFKYTGKGCILDMQLNEIGSYSIPFMITMKDGKVYKDRADIDLGGIYSFKVSLNTAHDIKPPLDAKSRPCFAGTEYSAKIESMTIGDYTFRLPNVVFGDEKTFRVYPKNLGMIGLPLFMKFNIIFDYFNNKIYLEPNENFNNAF